MTRTCFVTRDFLGPVKNGGIGTAFTSLARLMAKEGHAVTVLYIPAGQEENPGRWAEEYAKEGIAFVRLEIPEDTQFLSSATVRDAYLAHRWLKERDGQFDIIHFHDWHGVGAYAVLAKKQGLAFSATHLVMQLHAQVLWHLHYNAAAPDRYELLESDALEKIAIEHADTVVSPSRYMLEWTRDRCITLPEDSRVIQNVMADMAAPHHAGGQVNEFVFFGRLETRKGLELFCEALRRLPPELHRPVTFLGKEGRAGDIPARDYITQRLEGIVQWQILSTFGTEMAQEYLREPGRLGVIASLVENSPYVVLECLANSLPFIASSGGGTAELVAEQDRARVLFAPAAPSLAAKLEAAVKEGVNPAALAVSLAETRRTWKEFHKEAPKEKVARSKEQPLISVCMAHYNRPELLQRALESLDKQTYRNFEVIVTDDGSTDADALAYLKLLEQECVQKGWKLIRQQNKYLGAARNAAAKHAKGEWLLFMDDDNLAKPEELATFAAATCSGADIYACVQEYIGDAKKYYVPLGGALSAGFFENGFGDANALVKRSVFEKLGGFTEDHGVGLEDMEFFAKATLAGLRMEVVPEPLFLYRDNGDGMLHTTARAQNLARAIRPYLARYPEMTPALLLAQGYHQKLPKMDRHYAGLEKSFQEVQHANVELKEARTALDARAKALDAQRAELQGVLDTMGTDTVRFIQRLQARSITRALLKVKVKIGNAVLDGIAKLKR